MRSIVLLFPLLLASAAWAAPQPSTLAVDADAGPACPGWFPDPATIVSCGANVVIAGHAWSVSACSGRVAPLEWIVVSNGELVAGGAVLLNGPTGDPLSVGPCHTESGGGAFLLADCVAVAATLAPLGETPLIQKDTACGLFLG